MMPTARACCFPSATIVTTDDGGTLGVMMAPLDVKPGHIMLAPESTNVMAPLSTCMRVHMKGSRGNIT